MAKIYNQHLLELESEAILKYGRHLSREEFGKPVLCLCRSCVGDSKNPLYTLYMVTYISNDALPISVSCNLEDFTMKFLASKYLHDFTFVNYSNCPLV